jgi:hypothetical protein
MLQGYKTYIAAGIAVLSLIAGKLGWGFDFSGLDNDIIALLGALGAIWARKVAKPV